MFSSLGLFKRVDCPEQSHCSLSNCIFAHHSTNKDNVPGHLQPQPSALSANSEDCFDQDGPRKRRRLSKDEDDKRIPAGSYDVPRRQPLATSQAKDPRPSPKPPSRIEQEISPPPRRSQKASKDHHEPSIPDGQANAAEVVGPKRKVPPAPSRKVVEVSLNPKMISNPPASHAIRMQLITMMHAQMARLNEEVSRSEEPSDSALQLSPQDLIIQALEEEENVAKQSPAVYLNVVKLRITKLKKMKLAEWRIEVIDRIAKRVRLESSNDIRDRPKTIHTGLLTSQEIAFLSKILANQAHLTNFGYVATSPSNEEILEARKGVKAAQNWEQCDRCKTRFQVFPGRRADDGALTSGGTCSYHPARPRRPLARDGADKEHKELMYACCNETVGTSVGCTSTSTHVFKVSEPKRLATIMPFKATPPNSAILDLTNAVCFDCEMGYTTLGMELIRLTATSWPNGDELLDVLVRPMGEILDLNSQFSGVFPQDYVEAIPYKAKTDGTEAPDSKNGTAKLCLVESPAVARELLFELLAPETPLIGHAIENDLNATRVIHPSIVDSVLLYPHPRGLPIRYGLKVLVKRYLDRDIQMAGSRGHDSKEDARAAGDLVRHKISEMWQAMQKDGWRVQGREFFPPLPQKAATMSSSKCYGAQVTA